MFLTERFKALFVSNAIFITDCADCFGVDLFAYTHRNTLLSFGAIVRGGKRDQRVHNHQSINQKIWMISDPHKQNWKMEKGVLATKPVVSCVPSIRIQF